MIFILYQLFAIIDSFLYGLASSMFGIIYDIATTDFFKPEQITEVANRIYVVVGVLMLFKLVMAAIQYMINPDTFDDREKGMGGLLQKIAISLGLIVIVPAIFDFMIYIQRPIIRTLPPIILGGNATESTSEDDIGFDLSFQVLQAFVRARSGKGGSVGIGSSYEIHDIWSFNAHIQDGCPWSLIQAAFTGTDNCQYDYMIIVSSLGGAFLCYILLSMILDIAIRTIKLGIIQILAPIPISSYVFSKEKLSKFAKTAMTVYTDLFVRMAIVYFIIFAIREMIFKNNLLNFLSIGKGGVSDTGNWFRGVIVNIAIIFGLLMFAKNAPKFLSELLGLPDIGSGDIAEMFKPAWKRAGGAAAQFINPLRNAIASGITSKQQMDAQPLRDTKFHFKNEKIEALRQKLRKARRIAGAGMRGYATGVADSVQGALEGDDWAKMRARTIKRDTADFKRAYKAAYYRKMSRGEAFNQKKQRVVAALQSFVGQTPVDSKGYKDASSMISTFRSETFTGRAKGEVDKAPAMFRNILAATSGTDSSGNNVLNGGDLLISREEKDAHGNVVVTRKKVRTKFDVTDAAGNSYGDCDYEKLHMLFVKQSTGNATDADYASFTCVEKDAAGKVKGIRTFTKDDAAIISDIHERVGKASYAEYVNIAKSARDRIIASDRLPDGSPDKLTSDQRKILSDLVDREVLDRYDRFVELIVGLNIPGEAKVDILKHLENDPGKWLAGSNKLAQEYSTEATRREIMEQANNSGNS